MTDKDTEQTKVIFRKFPKYAEYEGRGIIALFPEEPGDNNPVTCMTYMHIGQHSAGEASAGYTVPASPEEYAPLMRELERIGYNLRVVKRFTRKDYEIRKAAIAAIRG